MAEFDAEAAVLDLALQRGWGSRGPRPSGVIARFWRKVARSGPDDCWEWTGARDADGYGLFGPARRLGIGNRAHIFAWFLAHGDPGDLCVLHRCDNPPCCNEAHLFTGTVGDNNTDMHAKGRGYRFTLDDAAKSGRTRRKGAR